MQTQKSKFVLRRVENIVGKGENAGNQHFLIFPVFSVLSKREIITLAKFYLPYESALNLVAFKILLFCKGLKWTHLQTKKYVLLQKLN